MKLPILTFKGWIKGHVITIILFVFLFFPPVFYNQHIYFRSKKGL